MANLKLDTTRVRITTLMAQDFLMELGSRRISRFQLERAGLDGQQRSPRPLDTELATMSEGQGDCAR
jgi:hypothetical protein